VPLPTVSPVRTTVAKWSELEDRVLAYAPVLVVIRFDDSVSGLYGRCHHRGALLSDGYIAGPNLTCRGPYRRDR
jgi:nitrite reductase/ring-hydroxylating ferredoxin subunit